MNASASYGLMGLGCDCQANATAQQKFNALNGLGAITHAQIVAFFTGDRKFTYSGADTPVYSHPGGSIIKTVKAGDTIGKVESVNEKGNWLYLRKDQYNPNGGAVLTSDRMYTVILTREAPDGVVDAVGREVKDIAAFSLQKILIPVAITAGVVMAALYFGKTVIEQKATKVAMGGVKKIKKPVKWHYSAETQDDYYRDLEKWKQSKKNKG